MSNLNLNSINNNNNSNSGHSNSSNTQLGISSGQTQTQIISPTRNYDLTLSLQATNSSTNSRSVQWDESVIDNEGMGKKSSKVCCIYHKPKRVGESSSEDSSSSDDGGPNAYERQPKYKSKRKAKFHPHCDDKNCEEFLSSSSGCNK